jgi:hypothetical protein
MSESSEHPQDPQDLPGLDPDEFVGEPPTGEQDPTDFESGDQTGTRDTSDDQDDDQDGTPA